MRKIKLQMQISLDGFVCGPEGQMDWMVWDWDGVVKNYVIDLTSSVDTVLLGRAAGEGMAVYWPTVAGNPQSSEEEKWIAERLNQMPKVVFSKTITRIDWTNARVASNILEEVTELKKQRGKDIMIYGGAALVSSFIRENLIDEYHLFINPVLIGKGKTIFGEVGVNMRLKRKDTILSSTGIVILRYLPEKENALSSSLKNYEYETAG